MSGGPTSAGDEDLAPVARPGPTGDPGGPQPNAIVPQFQVINSVSPYLSPGDLKAYREIDPALAERLLKHNLATIDRLNAERETAARHRRDLQLRSLERAIADQQEGRRLEARGQWIAGYVVVPLGFLVCGVFGALGHPWPAATIGSTMLTVVIASFLGSKLSSRQQGSPKTDTRPPSPD